MDNVTEALSHLNSVEKDLLIGRLELQMSYQELALHTGNPFADAARKATHRAIEKMARSVKRDDV
jgi:DNA-directed RNA polymerase specialized sigma24 family protein